MIIAMRLPVTRSRRCVQITAFGASDVPDVKISAQIVSTSGSSPGSVVAYVGERGVERRRRSTADRRVGEAVDTSTGGSVGDRREQRARAAAR